MPLFSHLSHSTYSKSWRALAHIWSYALTITRTVVYVITVKLRTIVPSPSSIAEACGTNAVTIVETTIWTADNYKKTGNADKIFKTEITKMHL